MVATHLIFFYLLGFIMSSNVRQTHFCATIGVYFTSKLQFVG